MRKLYFGSGGVDWQERINYERLQKERLDKVQIRMRKSNLAVVLVNDVNNLRYSTSTRSMPYPLERYALVFADRDPIVYETGEIIVQNRVNAPWIKEWRHANVWEGGTPGPDVVKEEAKHFAVDIKRDLDEAGYANERLGYDFLDEAGKNALLDEKFDLVCVNDLFLEARRHKTVDEINCIRMATRIGEQGFARICQAVKVGMTENEASAEGVAAMTRAGADIGALCGVTSGPRCFELTHSPNTDRVIQFGDTMYAQVCNTAFNGYRTCYWRNFVVGRKPTDQQKDWMKKCYDRVHRVISEIKPGATTADAAKHLGVAREWGYKDPRAIHAGEVGHGIGLSVHEYPFMKPTWSEKYPLEFEEGMVMAIECREGENYVGGVRLEEVIVVTENGCDVIGSWPGDTLIVVDNVLGD